MSAARPSARRLLAALAATVLAVPLLGATVPASAASGHVRQQLTIHTDLVSTDLADTTIDSDRFGANAMSGDATVNGEPATASMHVTFNYVDAAGTFHGNVLFTTKTGDTLGVWIDGATIPVTGGTGARFNGVTRILNGTGAFAGARGIGTFTGGRDNSTGLSLHWDFDIDAHLHAAFGTPTPTRHAGLPAGVTASAFDIDVRTTHIEVATIGGTTVGHRTLDGSTGTGKQRLTAHVDALLQMRAGYGPVDGTMVLTDASGTKQVWRVEGYAEPNGSGTASDLAARATLVSGTGKVAKLRGIGTMTGKRGASTSTAIRLTFHLEYAPK